MTFRNYLEENTSINASNIIIGIFKAHLAFLNDIESLHDWNKLTINKKKAHKTMHSKIKCYFFCLICKNISIVIIIRFL